MAAVLVVASGCTDPGLFDMLGEQNPPWLLEASTYRRRLIVENTTGTEALSNVPVKVTLTKDSFDFEQTDGTDLRFYAKDQMTELYYEVERWDETGESVIWVLVDAIAAETRDFLWMYWGGGETTTFRDSTKVWADYVLVLHFDDDLTDSSPSGYAGVATGTISYEAGVSGKGLRLDDGEYVNYDGYVTDYNGQSLRAYTIEVWIKATDAPDSSGSNGPLQAQNHFNLGWDNGAEPGSFHMKLTDGWKFVPQATSFKANTEYYIAGTFDGASGRAASYRNAALDGELTGLTGATSSTASYLRLGDDGSLVSPSYTGLVDEVRVSFEARSAAWVDAQYRSLQGELVELGAVEGK